MIRPLERLGPLFFPKYAVAIEGDDFVVKVTPPIGMKAPPVTVRLTADEFVRYQLWRRGKLLIQDAFPDWSASERERLQTGLGDEDFKRLTRGEHSP